jgi:Na+(H+)/acetate symporter ActP
MSFQEKNVAVSFVSFVLVLGVYLIGIMRMVLSGGLNSTSLFRLWGLIIIMAIFFTIAATILTHILSAIVEAIRTGNEDPQIEDIADERDKLIDLQGTKATYTISSIGSGLAMLTFVLGQNALVLFSLLILASLVAQIAGDVYRLGLYRRGF